MSFATSSSSLHFLCIAINVLLEGYGKKLLLSFHYQNCHHSKYLLMVESSSGDLQNQSCFFSRYFAFTMYRTSIDSDTVYMDWDDMLVSQQKHGEKPCTFLDHDSTTWHNQAYILSSEDQIIITNAVYMSESSSIPRVLRTLESFCCSESSHLPQDLRLFQVLFLGSPQVRFFSCQCLFFSFSLAFATLKGLSILGTPFIVFSL